MPPQVTGQIEKVKMTENLPSTNSSVGLLNRCNSDESPPNETTVVAPADTEGGNRLSRSKIIDVAILCYINLINYMDRFTVAGILEDIMKTYDMTESQGGLLQTAFVLVYMLMAPLFGYLGDRFNRKYLMAIGVFFWSMTTLIGSFMPNFHLFLLCRCFVGIGEASYSTIAPTIISDLFVKDLRSKMLALFYFAIPVGSGLGYIIGSEVTGIARSYDVDVHEAWRWGLRATPVFGLIAVFLMLFVLAEPPRGESEGGSVPTTSFWSDIKYLFTNRSFVLSTIAFTCVTFVAGALSWWGPIFVARGLKYQNASESQINDVGFIFGATAMLAGIIGVPLGSFSGQKLRKKYPFADPAVCGVGLFLSFPLLAGGIVLAQYNTPAAYAVVFFGQVFLNLNWAVVSDIVLYVVVPTRRSSAEAFQILFSHMLGDAGSPYIVGLVADNIKHYFNDTVTATPTLSLLDDDFQLPLNLTTTTVSPTPDPDDNIYPSFKSLQYSLIGCLLFEVLGALFFFWNGFFIAKDKETCENMIAQLKSEQIETRKLMKGSSCAEEDIESLPPIININADEPEADQLLPRT